jgi:shikimate kinase
VIVTGPTGVGKTYLVRHIAELIGVPFVKADATKFSETGYVGGDVEDLVRELVQKADGDTERAEHGIEISPLPGATLHRETRGCVEYEHVVVLMDHEARDKTRILLRHRRRSRPGDRRGDRLDVRRQAQGLADGDPRLAVGALAIDPDLALAQQLLDPPLREPGETPPQPAIEPLLAILGPYLDQ